MYPGSAESLSLLSMPERGLMANESLGPSYKDSGLCSMLHLHYALRFLDWCKVN